MSSTSKEVCELWNGQRFIRTVGEAPLAEFICHLPCAKATPKYPIGMSGAHQQARRNTGSISRDNLGPQSNRHPEPLQLDHHSDSPAAVSSFAGRRTYQLMPLHANLVGVLYLQIVTLKVIFVTQTLAPVLSTRAVSIEPQPDHPWGQRAGR